MKNKGNLIVIFGPPAVGKMTVGRYLAEKTGYRLFHNHHSVEVGLALFDFGTPPYNELVRTIRDTTFRLAAESHIPGLIFTFVWDFLGKADTDYMQTVMQQWQTRSETGGVYFVELQAPQDVRLERNVMPDRLAEKRSKRDLIASRENLVHLDEHYDLATGGDFPLDAPYTLINNTDLSAAVVADKIVEAFGL